MDDLELLGYHGNDRASVLPTDGNGDENTPLLEFYRARCDAFQQERKEMMDRFSQLEISRETWHQTEWQNRMYAQEIVELKDEAARLRDELADAKETIASLRNQVDQAKIQEAEDRKRIQHLLYLTQPSAEEVTFIKDCRPGHASRFGLQETHLEPHEQANIHDQNARERFLRSNVSLIEEANVPGAAAGYAAFTSRTKRQQEQKLSKNGTKAKCRIIRTVYLPSEQADSLLLRVQLLTKELDEYKKLSEERIQDLLNNLNLMSAESKKMRQQHDEEISAKQQDVERMHRLLKTSMKEYLVLRHKFQDSQRQVQEENARQRSLYKQLETEKEEAITKAKADTQAVRETLKEEGNVYAEEFRQQAVARERDIHILKEQYVAVQESYGVRIADLQSRLTKLRRRYKNLETRRNLEMEGFARDITTLKRHIVKLENLCHGTKLTQDELRSLRLEESNNLNALGLDTEIAQLQNRYADLAAEISLYYAGARRAH
ncbi:Coiled-coil domain-containing protein 77 [Aphanomyces cochlioides]|nr:Coiled-coil domain-containing protein 77 [Aphanomyces cochlioides]